MTFEVTAGGSLPAGEVPAAGVPAAGVPAVLRLADRQHGVVLSGQLRSLGVSEGVLRRLAGQGWLVPVRRGAWAVGRTPTAWQQVVAVGWAVHTRSRSKFDRDRRRGNLLASHGWLTGHVTSSMSDQEILATAARLLVRRAAEPTGPVPPRSPAH